METKGNRNMEGNKTCKGTLNGKRGNEKKAQGKWKVKGEGISKRDSEQ